MYENFDQFYNSEECRKFIEKCKNIKKTARKNEKRVLMIVLLSVISSAVIGYAAFHIWGTVMFAIIVYLGATFLLFSVKKQSIISYINCYRVRLPELLGEFKGAQKVTVEEVDFSQTHLDMALPSADSFKNRMSNFYYFGQNTLKIAYSKAYNTSKEIFSGLVYTFYNKKSTLEYPIYIIKSTDNFSSLKFVKELYDGIKVYTENSYFDLSALDGFISELSEKYENFFVCVSNNVSLYLPYENDYLSGRPDKNDDLTAEAFEKQLNYLELGIKLQNLFE